MDFDPCQHHLTQVVLKAGAVIRRLENLPEEKNITTLMDWTVKRLKISEFVATKMRSGVANHLPSPYEIGANERDGNRDDKIKAMADKIISKTLLVEISKKLREHKQICPKCGKRSMELFDLCRSCDGFKAGYRSEWRCIGIRDDAGKIIDNGCGERQLNNRFVGQWINEFAEKDPEFRALINQNAMISKKEVGIQTITNEGIK